MRGDSLRDFYAKTLALVGLAVLAGVGALVDYWPAGFRLPVAPEPSLMPLPVDARALAREPVELALFDPARPVFHPAAFGIAPQTSAASVGAAASEPILETAPLPVADLPAPVTLAANDVITAVQAPAEVTMTMLDRAGAGAGAESGLADTEFPAPMRASLAGVGGDDSGDGLLASAFKKTGSSIVKTGARTGASFFDALRVVSGVVRRALPTN